MNVAKVHHQDPFVTTVLRIRVLTTEPFAQKENQHAETAAITLRATSVVTRRSILLQIVQRLALTPLVRQANIALTTLRAAWMSGALVLAMTPLPRAVVRGPYAASPSRAAKETANNKASAMTLKQLHAVSIRIKACSTLARTRPNAAGT